MKSFHTSLALDILSFTDSKGKGGGEKKKKKKKRIKKKTREGEGGVFLWLGVCSQQNLLLFCVEKLEMEESLIPCCKAGNTDIGNGTYQPKA
ncbi:hypothetical protein llap_14184 [Limosa lapponica baueri]|uniref:Uncharacterized protein n=1 Tax=Limosa lapponica baueri TaxID=1758121 RepID=A0A2I0TNX3_LIMLA|nr:hypothetical protein llap_14184 [Limosa lapponica baueri]